MMMYTLLCMIITIVFDIASVYAYKSIRRWLITSAPATQESYIGMLPSTYVNNSQLSSSLSRNPGRSADLPFFFILI